jgi:ADP-ribose pyrophosphatase
MGARLISSRRVHAGRVVSLDLDDVEEPGGIRVEREVVRHPGSVAILPVHEDGSVTLVRQYRRPADALLWELPAGRLEPGEDPLRAAARELEEEAGLAAGALELLGAPFFTTPGFCDERLQLVRATRLRAVPARPESDECLEARSFSLEELRRLERDGQLQDGKTLLALLLERERRR